MYDKGYVLVSPHDMAVINDDGTMSKGRSCAEADPFCSFRG